MCNALKFPRSTYYKALLSEPSNKKKQYEEFSEKVMECYLDNKKDMELLKSVERLMILALHVVLNECKGI